MEKPWRPLSELPSGHYAVGKLPHGGEAHIFNAGGAMLDVATGAAITGIIGWRRASSPHASTTNSDA